MREIKIGDKVKVINFNKYSPKLGAGSGTKWALGKIGVVIYLGPKDTPAEIGVEFKKEYWLFPRAHLEILGNGPAPRQ